MNTQISTRQDGIVTEILCAFDYLDIIMITKRITDIYIYITVERYRSTSLNPSYIGQEKCGFLNKICDIHDQNYISWNNTNAERWAFLFYTLCKEHLTRYAWRICLNYLQYLINLQRKLEYSTAYKWRKPPGHEYKGIEQVHRN